MTEKIPNKASNLPKLLEIMARLRHPDNGCPWDLAQDFRSIASCTIEEAHEVADAIEREDFDDLKDELGDLLFQVVFHSRLAEELGLFVFDDVASAIVNKLERRHPHIFGELEITNQKEVKEVWERIKAEEREAKGEADDSVLAGISRGLPALRRAIKLQKRAAQVGFDWTTTNEVIAKIKEELGELEVELKGADRLKIEDELGDLLFAITNLARQLEIDPGGALRRGNQKFEARFRAMEQLALDRKMALADMPLEEQEALWREVKQKLRQ
jgi:ATP diphosphatase